MEIKENKCKLKKQHKTKTKKCPGEPGRNPFRTRGKSIKLDYHYLEINKGLGKRKRHPTGHRIRRRGEREAAKKQSNNKNKKIVKGNGSELKKKRSGRFRVEVVVVVIVDRFGDAAGEFGDAVDCQLLLVDQERLKRQLNQN